MGLHPIATLPFGPLAERLGDVSDREMARRAGLHTDSTRIAYWREHGVSWIMADRVAIHIGCHPAEVWGDAWLEIITVPTDARLDAWLLAMAS